MELKRKTMITNLTKWTFITVIGFCVGTLISMIPATILYLVFDWSSFRERGMGCWELAECFYFRTSILEVLIYDSVVNAFLIFILSLFQWMMLRNYCIRFLKWALWSSLGYLFQCWYTILLNSSIIRNQYQYNHTYSLTENDILYILGGLAAAMSLGLCQWVVIRNIFKKSGIWMLFTTFGFILGKAFIYFYNSIHIISWSILLYPFNTYPGKFIGRLLYDLDASFTMGLFIGFFSGICYALLPKKSIHIKTEKLNLKTSKY